MLNNSTKPSKPERHSEFISVSPEPQAQY